MSSSMRLKIELSNTEPLKPGHYVLAVDTTALPLEALQMFVQSFRGTGIVIHALRHHPVAGRGPRLLRLETPETADAVVEESLDTCKTCGGQLVGGEHE